MRLRRNRLGPTAAPCGDTVARRRAIFGFRAGALGGRSDRQGYLCFRQCRSRRRSEPCENFAPSQSTHRAPPLVRDQSQREHCHGDRNNNPDANRPSFRIAAFSIGMHACPAKRSVLVSEGGECARSMTTIDLAERVIATLRAHEAELRRASAICHSSARSRVATPQRTATSTSPPSLTRRQRWT